MASKPPFTLISFHNPCFQDGDKGHGTIAGKTLYIVGFAGIYFLHPFIDIVQGTFSAPSTCSLSNSLFAHIQQNGIVIRPALCQFLRCQ